MLTGLNILDPHSSGITRYRVGDEFTLHVDYYDTDRPGGKVKIYIKK